MAEVVEEHHHANGGSNSMNGVLIAVILVALIIFLFFVFGRGLFGGGNSATPSVSVPEQVDVNVDGGQGGGQ